MNIDFYQDQLFQYAEIATVLGVSDGKAQLHIGAIMPSLGKSSAVKTKKARKSTNNVLNEGARSSIEACTVSNYISTKIPSYMHCSAGDKVLVVFPGGELNKPRIIGEY